MLNEFLSFKKMITPIVIQIVFWLAAVIIVIAGCLSLFSVVTTGAFASSRDAGPWALCIGIPVSVLLIVFGLLLARIYAEVLIVFFRIHDALNEISHSLDEIKRNNQMRPGA